MLNEYQRRALNDQIIAGMLDSDGGAFDDFDANVITAAEEYNEDECQNLSSELHAAMVRQLENGGSYR